MSVAKKLFKPNNEKNGTLSMDAFSDFQYNLVIYNNKLLIVESTNSLFLILFLVTLWDKFALRLQR